MPPLDETKLLLPITEDRRALSEDTTTAFRLHFREAPYTYLLAHFVSFVLLNFPSWSTGLYSASSTPVTFRQVCLFVTMYAVLAAVQNKWMMYMSSAIKADTAEREKKNDATAPTTIEDFVLAVAEKAAFAAVCCAVGYLIGWLRPVCSAMGIRGFVDGIKKAKTEEDINYGELFSRSFEVDDAGRGVYKSGSG